MKKNLFVLLFAGFSFATFAQQSGFISTDGSPGYSQGGFNGPSPTLSTVSQAKRRWDDAWVVLEGHITKQVGHELYEFRDNSGSVYVEIDDKYWMGQTASPEDKVRIEGEVDRDWDGMNIDVKSIRVLK